MRGAVRLPSGSVTISTWNLVSRTTGFVRVLAIGAALGTTFAGNTYQSANLVSNLLFELLAAGILSSVLVPTFVGHLQSGGRREVEELAGALLGVLLVGLGVVALAAMVGGNLVMRALTVAVDDPAVREAEVRLGAFLLWFFVPQILLYASGAVANGLLHAEGRFAAAAAAPVLNNMVVTLTMVAFWAAGDGGRPGLDLTLGRKLLLAVGTTAGVAAMVALPVSALWRSGLRLRPRWDPRHPGLRRLAKLGAWAMGYLAATQVLIATTLVLANRVEGGVIAYQIAFTFFLLPHALFAHPVYTALYPQLSADSHARDGEAFARRVAGGVRLTATFVVPASLALAVLARPILDLVSVGALDQGGGSRLVARVLAAYALGLIGYSCFHLLTRATYAAGDTRTPTLVCMATTVIGATLMVLWSSAVEGGDRVVVLGWSHSIVMVGAAAALGVTMARRTRPQVGAPT